MKNKIISTSQGGLANRMICLINSMKISDVTGRELLLFWPKDKSCNCNFKDLFENDIKEVSKEELKEVILSKDYEIYQNDLKNFKNKKGCILIDNAKFIAFLRREVRFRVREIPKKLREEFIKCLRKIEIKKEFLKIAKDFSSRFDKYTIGIHIRKGDYKILKCDSAKISNDELYIEIMKKELKENPNTNFFLATEEEETEKKFKYIFKDKIIIYLKKTKARGDEGAVKEALIDFLLLSKTKKIYGTFESTFSQLASLFGGNKLEVVIDKNEYERFIKEKELEESNIINKLKKLVYNLIYTKEKRFFRIIIE